MENNRGRDASSAIRLSRSDTLIAMTERLKGKSGIITGAGSGIGRACAITMAREGAQLALAGRRKDRIEEVAREIGELAFAIVADVSKTSDISRLIDETVRRFGGLNFVLNNAGALHVGNAEQITEEQWDNTFNLNVRGVWLLSRAALPHMRTAGGGSIINVASILGLVGARNRAAYASSKGAVVQLTKSMAIDHGHENIRVNAICPSFVETELTERLIGQATDAAAFRKERIAAHPLGRLGQPEDIAGLAIYLASEESSWMTGAALPVDGGYCRGVTSNGKSESAWLDTPTRPDWVNQTNPTLTNLTGSPDGWKPFRKRLDGNFPPGTLPE